jgi:predicted signal transduction protein with EAL and GGDEF domain
MTEAATKVAGWDTGCPELVDVLAEGIETLPQERRLATLGVRYGQGHEIARPLTAVDFRARLSGRPADVWSPAGALDPAGAGAG